MCCKKRKIICIFLIVMIYILSGCSDNSEANIENEVGEQSVTEAELTEGKDQTEEDGQTGESSQKEKSDISGEGRASDSSVKAEEYPTPDYKDSEPEPTAAGKGILESEDDLELSNPAGDGSSYSFTYDDKIFKAVYSTDHWKIIDSYKITDINDMTIICQALIGEHKIHGSDMKSYRTAEDMAYEWKQHNIAYYILSDDSRWKDNARDVDLNPEDQGKSLYELYQDRTGTNYR